ncbi:hypothetical protein NDU88_012218 [Pleurodeles waltl]|uniref:Uncharacterized protein n=1 Tax=Pleurodeles waltl TaxID=8319 RepID=A0AAV7R107_PLEWA|nr:hypothetical protein NDU88_012218 [Pleurodeles waltl]
MSRNVHITPLAIRFSRENLSRLAVTNLPGPRTWFPRSASEGGTALVTSVTLEAEEDTGELRREKRTPRGEVSILEDEEETGKDCVGSEEGREAQLNGGG